MSREARIIKTLEKKTAILEKRLQESPKNDAELKSSLDSTIARLIHCSNIIGRCQ